MKYHEVFFMIFLILLLPTAKSHFSTGVDKERLEESDSEFTFWTSGTTGNVSWLPSVTYGSELELTHDKQDKENGYDHKNMFLERVITPGSPFLDIDNSLETLRLQEWWQRRGGWGVRPRDGEVSRRTPPSFVWEPHEEAVSYIVQVASDSTFRNLEYEADVQKYNVHTSSQTLETGEWFWRTRHVDDNGEVSEWSTTRTFYIDGESVASPIPPRKELLARVPEGHPRLFVRPEQLPELRALADDDLRPIYLRLVEQSEELLENPPATDEPPTYPDDIVSLSPEWREYWWGSRLTSIDVLGGAATLGFTYMLDGNEEYGELARRLLLEAAEWDPLGATGFQYNTEAGMPYAYYFSRTYTFIYDLLTPEEREKCRQVMRIRGKDLYDRLHYQFQHLWYPFSNHNNRAWHFLGEVGVAFFDEIPEAEEWLWYAVNVFANMYPVWGEGDGGWHQGVSYWSSYLNRFSWWADVMRAALDLDAYKVEPFFANTGYFAIYMQPPHAGDGAFADLNRPRDSSENLPIMSVLATQAQNPHWQWYVDAHEETPEGESYIDFVRASLPAVESRPPDDIPTSRLFRGTGQVAMNHTLLDGLENVSVLFKSSPYGSISHGYDAQNSFIVNAFGERLFAPSGRRDIHGSAHHRQWMHHTRSVNSITVNGHSQSADSPDGGQITRFHTSDLIDFVEGEAAEAYTDSPEGALDRFTRSIVYVKPEAIIIFDRLEAPEPSTFEWWLHAESAMSIVDQRHIYLTNKAAAARVAFLVPDNLEISQTDQFDPPPQPEYYGGDPLIEYHLTATVTEPRRDAQFVTVIQPHRSVAPTPGEPVISESEDGYVVSVPLEDGGEAIVLLNRKEVPFAAEDFRTDSDIGVFVRDADGNVVASFEPDYARLTAIHEP